MDIRNKFLEFFQNKGHNIYPSSPLLPNDSSLLFTNAGMVQFKDIFTSKVPPPKNKCATSSQLCIRAGGKHNDLDNVGYTARHHTLFEMLGNFSFGSYFKEMAIKYAWEFVTQELDFSKDIIYISVHNNDDEAFNIWLNYVNKDKIKRLGDKDNFWQMGDTGPCGPCSEIYIDQGEKLFNSSDDYFGGDGDRFLEIWNLVFMQYERNKDGELIPLKKPSIDTGMGLERVYALLEGKQNNFDTSLFMPIINECIELTSKPYNDAYKSSHRIIADHIRAISFLLAQGVNFNKEGRGYVLRRILRRALRHGYLLGVREPFLYKLVDSVCNTMKYYTYLEEKKEYVKEQCKYEEDRFLATIDIGMNIFKQELDKNSNIFSGKVAFKLYDTYGFPLDLTLDMLREKDIILDIESFNKCMDNQKQMAKNAWKGSGDTNNEGDFALLLDKFGENKFIGYDNDSSKSKILSLLDSNFNQIETLENKGFIFLDETPLYPESGGAIGDKGEIFIDNNLIGEIINTKKYFGLNISEVKLKKPINIGDILYIKVSNDRYEIAKHHTATHLLQASLRKLLGEHITQAGSLVEENRLRFDFTHNKALSKDEINNIESEINRVINLGLELKVEFLNQDEAKNKGALALFGEKYGDIVRVVSFGDFSCELCGGIHTINTMNLGNFYITKESGISSGVRRIEALCGKAGYKYSKDNINLVENLKIILKSNDILSSIDRLKNTITMLKDLKNNYKEELNFEQIGDIKIFIEKMDSKLDLKNIIDKTRNENDKLAILLLSSNDNNIKLYAGIKGINCLDASLWVKEVSKIIGGSGGGRSDFAMGGGKEINNINSALKFAKEFVLQKIKNG